MPKLGAIGLDAMEWTLVERMLASGRLPHLASLRNRGLTVRLRHPMPYRAEVPWTTFLTGKAPAAVGYWGIVEFDPGDYMCRVVGALPAEPFFAVPGRRVIAFDIPHAVPSPSVEGIQVTSWGSHAGQHPRAAWPHGWLDALDERFGPHPGFDNDFDGGWHSADFLDGLRAALLAGAATRIDALEWLQAQAPDWDAVITVMSEPHSAGHHCWHGVDERHPLHATGPGAQARHLLFEVYEAVDRAVGRFVASLPPDAIVVAFAVNGMQSNTADVPGQVLLPELFHRLHFGRGTLTPPRGRRLGAGGTGVDPGATHTWRWAVQRRFAPTHRRRIKRLVGDVVPAGALEAVAAMRRRVTGAPPPIDPGRLPNRFPPEDRRSNEEIASDAREPTWLPSTWYRRWWPGMRWFALPAFSDAHIRINVAGRERHGVVPPGEFGDACDEVSEILRSCTDAATGRPLVEEVIRTKGTPDEAGAPAADLVVVFDEPAEALHHPHVGRIGPFPFHRTGEHSAGGFALMAGPGVPRLDAGERPMIDLPATLAGVLGHPGLEALAGSPFWTVEPERHPAG